jgi:hypothetical protein
MGGAEQQGVGWGGGRGKGRGRRGWRVGGWGLGGETEGEGKGIYGVSVGGVGGGSSGTSSGTQHLRQHTSRGPCQAPGFPRERFPSLGGSRSAQSPNSKPCFIPPTYPPDSPPVELATCYLSSETQESPSEDSELPRRHTRSSPPPAVAPRCWSHLAVSPDTRPIVPPSRPLGASAEGNVDRRAAHPFPHPLPSLPTILANHARLPRVPPAEETKLCSTVVSTNAI